MDRGTDSTPSEEQYDFVIVANRLPVDQNPDASDDAPPEQRWRASPGGLVSGLAPVMRARQGAWVGWAGVADTEIDPFDHDDMHLVPVPLDAGEVASYYEGFSNATLWPLYHDVIVPPEFHRTWWDAYQRVNARFATAASQVAAPGATVWVHDYQLQLVPALLRAARPDVKIGFFNHIPFPPYEIYAQLPWRRQILQGLLGADLLGFQRPYDAANFRRSVRRNLGLGLRGRRAVVPARDADAWLPAQPEHEVQAAEFPISIDTAALDALARKESVQRRAAEIREEVGNPKVLMLGVDRMDYTKGIWHRLKAVGELFREGTLGVENVTLIQIATPSRERLEHYQQIRHDVELEVGRINGELGELSHTPVHYLHQSFPREEMAAFYLAADLMLVTALRDGMNLVAKEYVATRVGGDGVLVLSEFTGAADELTQAVLVNPHDIAGLKAGIVTAATMEAPAAARRMKRLRTKVADDDVLAWSEGFIAALDEMRGSAQHRAEHSDDPQEGTP